MKRTITTLVAGLLLAGLLVPGVVLAEKDKDILLDVPLGHFRGHDYKWVPVQMTWPEARDYCWDDGGYLVTVTSKAENKYVWARRPGWRGQSWLGASDKKNEGTWVWVTGEPFEYAPWAPDNPEPPGSEYDEDYLAYHGLLAEQPRLPGAWVDYEWEEDGSKSTQPFTCEYGEYE